MIGLRLLAVLLLVAINGFFASAEFSLVAVRASHVRQLVRTLGVTGLVAGHTIPHSAEELQVQIRQAGEHGLLAPGEERVILGALDMRQTRVRDIMIPRPDVHALPVESGFEETLALFAKTQRSRLPVYESSLDHVLGFVHLKDLLPVLSSREGRPEQGTVQSPSQSATRNFDLRGFLRELLIVPESKLAGELLIEMRARRISLAMVVDEFASVRGWVNLEDVLEQMVGEIHDEFDVVQAPQIVGSGPEMAMVFDGAVGLHDLETQYEIKLPEDPAYATLGGFVLTHLGFIPRGGESFDFAGYRFTVLEMERRRVARIKLQRLIAAAPARAVRHPTSAG